MSQLPKEILKQRCSGVYRLSDEERMAVREGLAQAERGEFVPEEKVAAFFDRYR